MITLPMFMLLLLVRLKNPVMPLKPGFQRQAIPGLFGCRGVTGAHSLPGRSLNRLAEQVFQPHAGLERLRFPIGH